MRKSRFKILISLMVLAISSTAFSYGQRPISIEIGGKTVYSDVAPYIKNSRTMVPLRLISENLGADVGWRAQTREVLIKFPTKNLDMIFREGQSYYQKNGQMFGLDSSPEIKNSRTFVPIRVVAEAFGLDVDWDNSNRIVKIGNSKLSDSKEDTALKNNTQMWEENGMFFKKTEHNTCVSIDKITWYPLTPDSNYKGKYPEFVSDGGKEKQVTSPVKNNQMTDEEKCQRVFEIVNEEREKEGKAPLKYAYGLQDYANLRAKELIEKFSHDRPNGQSGLDYVISKGLGNCGENIAAGGSSSEATMNQWMNSTGHRNNILSSNFKYVTVGYSQGGPYGNYWVQLFSNRDINLNGENSRQEEYEKKDEQIQEKNQGSYDSNYQEYTAITGEKIRGMFVSDSKRFIELLNQHRVENGLEPVKHPSEMDEHAKVRCIETAIRLVKGEGLSHKRLDGRPAQYIGYGGENLSAGLKREEDIFNQWKNSSGHNAHMLFNSGQDIGYGYATFVFDGPYGSCAAMPSIFLDASGKPANDYK